MSNRCTEIDADLCLLDEESLNLLCDITDLHQGSRPLPLQGGDQPGSLVTPDDASVRHQEVLFPLNDVSEEDDVLNHKSHDRDQWNDNHHGCVQGLTSSGSSKTSKYLDNTYRISR